MDYCGCCGNEIEGRGEWCKDCLTHIVDTYRAPWDNTYYAQYGEECPFRFVVEEDHENWEYRCNDCGQLRFSLGEDKPIKCGACGSTSITVGRPGTLPDGTTGTEV